MGGFLISTIPPLLKDGVEVRLGVARFVFVVGVGDSVLCHLEVISILFDSDKLATTFHTGDTTRTTTHAVVENRFSLVRVGLDKELQ